MEQDQKNDQAKKQEPKRDKPQPGRNPVKQKVVMHPTAGEYGWFIHDMSIPVAIADCIARRFHPNEERLNNDFPMYDDYRRRVLRFVCMLLARKLAASPSHEQRLEFGGFLKHIAQVPSFGLSALIPLIDHFGCIEEEKLKFSMIGQPILAFSYFARATIEEDEIGGVDLERAIFVNTRWPRGKRMLYDMAITIISAFAESAPPAEFNFPNNVRIVMGIPKPSSGMRGYAAFINHVPKPPIVARMLAICSALETHLAQDIPQDVMQVLNGQQVFFVDWNSAQITTKGENYAQTVESRLKMSFQTAANWVEITAMKTVGSGAQLLMKGTEHIFYSPVELKADTIDLGWMFASDHQHVQMNQRSYYIVPEKTQKHGLIAYVDNMMKLGF